MELRHLRYFVAVAEALSFNRAAARLRVAQPSLSTQIRALEDELGLRLLDRDRSGVALTAVGAVFLKEARAVLARAETAVRRAHEAASGSAGQLRVATMGQLTFHFFPAALARFRAAVPGARVTVSEMAPPEQLALIARGEIDLGFVPAPFPRVASARKFATTPILRSPLVAMLAASHPLAGARSIRLADLAEETFLFIRIFGADTQRTWTQETCRKAGFTPRFGAGAQSPENLIGMVAAGEGVALIPKTAQRGPAPGVVYVPVAGAFHHDLLAVTNAQTGSGLVEQFLKITQEETAVLERTFAAEPPEPNAGKKSTRRRKA